MSNELLEAIKKNIENAPFDWVLVRVATNKENSVRHRLRSEAISTGLNELIPEIVVLEEPRIRIKDDGSKEYQNINVLPGYILVNMDIYDEELLAMIRHTDGVLGFSGDRYNPAPISPSDTLKYFSMAVTDKVQAKSEVTIQAKEVKGKTVSVKSGGTPVSTDLVVGDVVVVLDGPFESMTGVVSALELEHERAQVLISAFGRETPVDLKLSQIRKQSNAV